MGYRLVVVFVLLIAVNAHAGIVGGELTYTPPTVQEVGTQNVTTLNRNFDETWAAVVAFVGDSFFVIDQLEKASGFVNLSFTADDPERFVDCGSIISWVKNLRGRREYEFAAASKHEQYEQIANGQLFRVERKFSLSGKVNILVTKVTESTTRIKVNAKYVGEKELVASVPLNYGRAPERLSMSSSFSTSSPGTDEAGTTCATKLTIERALLDGIEKAAAGTVVGPNE